MTPSSVAVGPAVSLLVALVFRLIATLFARFAVLVAPLAEAI